MAQLAWGDIDALRAAFASPEGQATAADVPNLTRYAQTSSIVYEVTEL